MRVALIGLQSELTPPAGYGAVGRIVAGLAQTLGTRIGVVPVVAEGSALSMPALRVPFVGRRGIPDPQRLAPYRKVLAGCDVVHNHDPAMTEWLVEHLRTPVVTTLHTNRIPESAGTSRFGYLSGFQARTLCYARFAGWTRPIITSPNRPFGLATRSPDLLMLGQVRPEKGVVEACQLAAAANRRLLLAGPIPRRYERWFASEVSGYLDAGRAVWLGEVTDPVRARLLRTCCALVFCSWPAEPLGLVMLEAMAAGTPVLALDRGACAEVVADGQSGFVRADVEALAAVVDDLGALNSDLVRKSVECFAPDCVVAEHLRLYTGLAQGGAE